MEKRKRTAEWIQTAGCSLLPLRTNTFIGKAMDSFPRLRSKWIWSDTSHALWDLWHLHHVC